MSKSTEFVKSDLLPEMVHNRCFCEAGSREFVEFESANVETLRFISTNSEKPWECYRAKAVVRFSGEPESFPLIVKLLSPSVQSENAFARFQNEEMFYSKMVSVYGKENFSKCYLSDLGRYGMPVIVLEDLIVSGYETIQRKLKEDELKLCIESLAKFHAKGFRLKEENFQVFREFYAKLLETTFDEESMPRHEKTIARILEGSKSLRDSSLAEEVVKALGSNPLETARKACMEINDVSCICHGAFSRSKMLFRRDEKNASPIDGRMIDWQTMRYCSPAIDLATILLTNFPVFSTVNVESSSSPAWSFLQEMLTYYVDAVKREYPVITCERLKEEILSVLPDTIPYVVLSCQEDFTDERSIETLAAFSRVFREYSRRLKYSF